MGVFGRGRSQRRSSNPAESKVDSLPKNLKKGSKGGFFRSGGSKASKADKTAALSSDDEVVPRVRVIVSTQRSKATVASVAAKSSDGISRAQKSRYTMSTDAVDSNAKAPEENSVVSELTTPHLLEVSKFDPKSKFPKFQKSKEELVMMSGAKDKKPVSNFVNAALEKESQLVPKEQDVDPLVSQIFGMFDCMAVSTLDEEPNKQKSESKLSNMNWSCLAPRAETDLQNVRRPRVNLRKTLNCYPQWDMDSHYSFSSDEESESDEEATMEESVIRSKYDSVDVTSASRVASDLSSISESRDGTLLDTATKYSLATPAVPKPMVTSRTPEPMISNQTNGKAVARGKATTPTARAPVKKTKTIKPRRGPLKSLRTLFARE